MIRRFNTTNHKYEFHCESIGTRSGFKHVVEMYKDEYPYSIAEATVHYINRTWECHQFDTAIHRCIGKLILDREEMLRNNFKHENGYKVLTSTRKNELKKVVEADEKMKELNELYGMIND